MSYPDDEHPTLRPSPTPWGPWDKHANLYDANDEVIAHFDIGGVPSKNATDLANRNRAAICVNALHDIREPHAFVDIAKLVATGKLPHGALKLVMEDAKAFTVRGTGPDGKVKTLDPQTLSDARYIARLHHDGAPVTVIFIPTGKQVPA